MAFFVLCSDITIGSFRFGGVHEVRVKRSIHSYADSAVITLPSVCKIKEGKKASVKEVTTADQFNEGDPVIINLGYNNTMALQGDVTPVVKGKNDRKARGFMCTVFQGFVKRKNINMPLEVECEGYARKLRLDVNVKKSFAKTKVSEVLKLLEKDKNGKSTGIKVRVADDINLVGVKFPSYNGIDVIEAIKRMSQGVLNVFFIEPATPWCGLTYTAYSQGKDPFNLQEISYRMGYNVVKDNSLKERDASGERVKIVFAHKSATGDKVSAESDDGAAMQVQKTLLNYVEDPNDLKKMAQEKQFMVDYSGYEGSINGFLQPWCEPGWLVNISDRRYPKRDGKYLVEATEVTFGTRGARIKVDIGPQLGFGNKK